MFCFVSFITSTNSRTRSMTRDSISEAPWRPAMPSCFITLITKRRCSRHESPSAQIKPGAKIEMFSLFLIMQNRKWKRKTLLLYRGLSWCRGLSRAVLVRWKRVYWKPGGLAADQWRKWPTCCPIGENKCGRNGGSNGQMFRKVPRCRSTANSREKASPPVLVASVVVWRRRVTIATPPIQAEDSTGTARPTCRQNRLPSFLLSSSSSCHLQHNREHIKCKSNQTFHFGQHLNYWDKCNSK